MTCPCNGSGAIDHGDSLEICGCPAPESFALRPLTSFCDRSAAMVTGFRASGKWHIRINGVTGIAVRFEEAVANAMNLVFAAQGDAMGEGASR